MVRKLFSRILFWVQDKVLSKVSLDIGSNKHVLRGDCYFSFSKSVAEYIIRDENKLIELKKNLDKKSKDLVDIIFNRYYYIYTHNILERDKIITKNEINNFKKVKKFMVEFKKTTDFVLEDFDETIFYYKHGLKCLPNENINNLEDTDFIDGGAYIGDSALMFENYYQPRQIYSFEPNSKNYEMLKKTIEINNLKKVVPIQMGLGKIEAKLPIKDIGHGSCISNVDGDYDVKVTSLDNFVRKNDLTIGLIKLDIEGYGLEAIKGAQRTIEEFKPVLLMSIYHCAEEFFEIKTFIENLDCNYNIIIRKLAPLKPFFDTNLIAWSKIS